MIDLARTVEAKVDQLTADELLGGPRTIQITKVTGNEESDQPISIHFQGDEGKPFKPCKTVRRVLMHMWGRDGAQFVGRSLTLYRDETVRFGGLQVGGVRVSHASHIEREMTIPVTTTRGKKAPVKVKPLKAEAVPLRAVETTAPPSQASDAFDFDAFEAEVNAKLQQPGDDLVQWWAARMETRKMAGAQDRTRAVAIAERVKAALAAGDI